MKQLKTDDFQDTAHSRNLLLASLGASHAAMGFGIIGTEMSHGVFMMVPKPAP